MNKYPVMVVHGGAWGIPNHLEAATRAGVQAAVRKGYQMLQSGSSALDAVEAAVCSMEDDPAFDAGIGSCLNDLGEVEMDAAIMDGLNLHTGAVACVQNIQHPITLARLVMEKTKHTLLVGKGANRFAQQMGVKTVPTEQLVTEESKQQLHGVHHNFQTNVDFYFKLGDSGHDTCGAIALDQWGNLAAATSTGGLTAKMPGRVGDSPIIGCGTYCDNQKGAVSCTGHGEAIMRVCLAHHITTLLQTGEAAQTAAEGGIAYLAQRVHGTGGAIVLSHNGDIGKHFNTERMAWASIKDNVLNHGLEPDEIISTCYP